MRARATALLLAALTGCGDGPERDTASDSSGVGWACTYTWEQADGSVDEGVWLEDEMSCETYREVGDQLLDAEQDRCADEGRAGGAVAASCACAYEADAARLCPGGKND